LPPLAP